MYTVKSFQPFQLNLIFVAALKVCYTNLKAQAISTRDFKFCLVLSCFI